MQVAGIAPQGGQGRVWRVGLIGQGIQRSRTPAMHRAEAAAQGFALRYDLLDTDRMDPVPPLRQVLEQAEAEGYAGLNVTYPYKKEVMPLLDGLSVAARKVGAVNTVVFRDGRRFGHNTDFWGFGQGLRQGLPGASLGTVLLLGAGGAGGAVAHALADAGAQRLLIADARVDAAQSLAHDIATTGAARAEVVQDMAAAARAADGIVNATPMGMAKLPGMAMDAGLLRPSHWVCDIIYFPLETALLAQARACGCRVLNGAPMAVFQAVRAFELFTGQVADPARMRHTFENFAETPA